MWEYLAVLFAGFWLGVAIFLYVSCYWVEEILDLPAAPRDGERPRAREPGASGPHARLKRLVGRVIEEAMALPALAHYAQRHTPTTAQEDTFDSKTYEDLLATAILNKVIERYQAESTGGRSGGASSGIHSASASPTPSAPSSASVSPPHSPHTPPPLHDEDDDNRSDSEWEHHDFSGQEFIEMPRRVPFPEFGGDIIHCTDSGELDDEILEELSGSDLQAVDGSWEENWLFQKKKVKSLQSVPVPMLVPNPNEDYKAMIGDRDVDDTTDLSDVATDSEEEQEYKSDIGRSLQSKTLIGGKIPTGTLLELDAKNNNGSKHDFKDFENTNETSTEVQEVTAEFDSSNDSVVVIGIESGPLNKAEFSVSEIHRKLYANSGQDETDSFIPQTDYLETNKLNSNTMNTIEKEGEYEEEIAKPVQRYADSLRRQHDLPDNTDTVVNGSNIDCTDIKPGSIADRERKKWLKCVEMPNNPYSAEAILKRLNNKSTSAVFDFITANSNATNSINTKNKTKLDTTTQKNNITEIKKEYSRENTPSPLPKVLKDVLAEEVPQYKRFGRDYYVNEAKRSAGARRLHNISASSLNSINKSSSLDHFDINDFNSTDHLIETFNSLSQKKLNTEQAISKRKLNQTRNTVQNREHILIEYEDADEQSLFVAKPAYIEDDTDEKFEDILRSAMEMSHQEIINCDFEKNDESLISSSSLEDSLKIYNVPNCKILKSADNQQKHDIYVFDNSDSIIIQDKSIEIHQNVKPVSDTGNKNVTNVFSSVNGKMAKIVHSDKNQEFEIKLPKVKDLAKKFVRITNQEDNQLPKFTPRRRKFSNDYELEVVSKSDPKLSSKNYNYMHSLTARSISREFREELKLSMATPIKVPGGSNDHPDGIQGVTNEDSRPISPIPEPGTLKNKLAFFEGLKL